MLNILKTMFCEEMVSLLFMTKSIMEILEYPAKNIVMLKEM